MFIVGPRVRTNLHIISGTEDDRLNIRDLFAIGSYRAVFGDFRYMSSILGNALRQPRIFGFPAH